MTNAFSVCEKNILSPETERGAGSRVLPATPKVAAQDKVPENFQKIIEDSGREGEQAAEGANQPDVEMDTTRASVESKSEDVNRCSAASTNSIPDELVDTAGRVLKFINSGDATKIKKLKLIGPKRADEILSLRNKQAGKKFSTMETLTSLKRFPSLKSFLSANTSV